MLFILDPERSKIFIVFYASFSFFTLILANQIFDKRKIFNKTKSLDNFSILTNFFFNHLCLGTTNL